MIRADLSDQTTVEDIAHKSVTATERYKRHGHYPALILVESNPTLAARLERALFEDHFEVALVNSEDVPLDIIESAAGVYQSMGLVVIYSSAAMAPEAKLRLRAVAGNRFFDLSASELPADESAAIQKLRSLLHHLRAVAGH